jgi:hypothetical protein
VESGDRYWGSDLNQWKEAYYRKNYDGPEIQITDVDQLSRIQQSNLEAELQAAAFKKAKRATWFGIDTALKNGFSRHQPI